MNLFKKIGALVLALALILSVQCITPVFAAGNIEIILTDVTETDLTTLSGEAKIKVSVKGAAGNVSIAQTSLNFTGNLKYKSIQFLKGENNPPQCFLYSPNTALTNSKKQLMPSIISNSSIPFDETTDLFILTFAGNPGETVTLSLSDLENTYCTISGNDLNPASTKSITATASSKENQGKKAVVSIIMDKVTDFTAGAEEGYNGSGVDVKITSEQTTGYTVYTVLNNTLTSNGGHRESESIPTFTVENTVLDNNTYTVEVSGLGYVPYKATGVTFDTALSITNSDFIPGDINADQKVDSKDKEECQKAIDDASYAAELGNAADFNRDGVCDRYDMDIFASIEDSDDNEGTTTPPSGDNEGTTTPPSGDNEGTTTPPAGDSGAGSGTTGGGAAGGGAAGGGAAGGGAAGGGAAGGGAAGGGAAGGGAAGGGAAGGGAAGGGAAGGGAAGGGAAGGGAAGGGAAGGGAAGGGAAGGGAAGGGAAGTTDTKEETDKENETTPTAKKEFTDIAAYSWAQDSIYTLQSKGIISGVSDTEFAPADNIKRGDFILILTRMLNTDAVATDNFADVPKDSYYYDAIAKAKAAGIATGDGISFMPENAITRQDLITLAYRAFLMAGIVEETTDYSILDQFNDKDTISPYASAPLASMVKAGIIKGSDDGSVNPQGYATRAEVAVMCARLLELIK